MGTIRLKVEPLPGSETTLISPPSSRARLRLMLKPSPVPPYCRVVLLSACWNSLKIRGMASGLIPMPVSSTSMRSRSSPSRLADTKICPSGVNLAALLNKLSTICRILSWSEKIRSRSGSICLSSFTLGLIMGVVVLMHRSISGVILKLDANTSIRPASILAISRVVLISESKCSALTSTFSRFSICFSGSNPSALRWTIRVNPIMALSGVRSSWLILARKALLALFAFSASARASMASL